MELLKKRLMELAEKAYRNNQYVFTNFLNMAEIEYQNKKLDDSANSRKYSTAVNLAKALYGKTPISQSVINSIISMLK